VIFIPLSTYIYYKDKGRLEKKQFYQNLALS
jgi:hypothetical protein